MSRNWHKNSIKKPARRRVTDQASGFEG
ncbi:TPA: hypothetical protein R4Z82_005271 [Enterobacter hormaechei subsp. xiangfangensis]|nr:hypothetical protein [Enterobacter hormaechei subsp. xiangfangensis]HED3553458.1 hypothetical protein [Enterobacter hormaechei subsp. xiangfangensis]